MAWIRQGFRALYPELTWQYNPRAQEIVNRYGPENLVVDIGAGGRRLGNHVVTVDFLQLPQTDIVADICQLPFANETVDLVVATGVLEHVADPSVLLLEARRVLRPSGHLHIEVPFLQQYHEDPVDYQRWTLPGMRHILEQHGFALTESGCHIGPTVTLITLVAHYWQIVFEGPTLLNKILANGIFWILSLVFFPFKYLDALIGKKKNAHQLAFGVYATARKGECQ